MPKNLIQLLSGLFLLLFLAAGCDNYNKVLKSSDVELKLTKAKEYYNKGNYYKAIPLLDELISIYRGREELQEVYLIYCYAHYGQGDYMVSAYNFKNYYSFYPASPEAEEALFMVAKSYYNISPTAELDQTNTLKAIESIQLYVSTFPGGKNVTEAFAMMNALQMKLEEKEILAARQYLDMQSYQAAAIAFENILEDYPASSAAEEIQFLVVKSYYLFAKNSIVNKQAERYEKVIKAYNDLLNKFPESDYLKEASTYFESAQQSLKNL